MKLEPLLKYPSIFLLAFLVTYLATPCVRAFARRVGMVDQPGGRRIHDKVIPRAGGFAVFLGFHAGAICVFFAPWLPFYGQTEVEWWYRFLLPSTLLVLIGLLDDWKNIHPLWKLSGQVFVSLLAIALDMRMGNVLGRSPPFWLDIFLTLSWFLLLINAFNLIDGLDGLATGLALVATCGIGLSLVFRKAPGDVLLFLALAGACVAFLRYNFQPASIFLGDSGSMFLGFTLAALSLSTQSKGPALAVLGFPLVAMGIPLIDTLLAIWRRSLHGNQIPGVRGVRSFLALAKADGEHLHHRFIQRGLSQRGAALSLYGLASVSTIVGLLVLVNRSRAQGVLLIAFVVVTYVMCRHLAWIELRKSGAAFLRGFSRPNPRNISIIAYPIIDVLSLIASLCLSIILNTYDRPALERFNDIFIRFSPVFVGIPMVALALVKAYGRIWSMARISEFMQLGFAAAAGVLIGLGLYILGDDQNRHFTTMVAFVHAGLALVLVLGSRSSVRIVQDLMAPRLEPRADRRGRGRTLLVGEACQLSMFLRTMGLEPLPAFCMMEVVGLVDNDRNVQGRTVYGYQVVGMTDELDRLLKDLEIRQVLLVGDLSSKDLATVKDAVNRHKVNVSRWSNIIETNLKL